MYARQYSLKKRSDIQSLFDRSNTEVGRIDAETIRLLFLRKREPTDTAPIRIGVAVGRRSGNAVRRNRIKRVIRDEARACLNTRRPDLTEALIVMAIYRGTTFDAKKTRSDFDRAWVKMVDQLNVEVSSGS